MNYQGKVNYEFIQVEGEGEIGPLIKEYVDTERPDLSMLVVGTRLLRGVQKLFLGSVSDYLVHK